MQRIKMNSQPSGMHITTYSCSSYFRNPKIQNYVQAGEHRNVHNPKLELSCYLHIAQKYPYNTGSNFRKFWFLWDGV